MKHIQQTINVVYDRHKDSLDGVLLAFWTYFGRSEL